MRILFVHNTVPQYRIGFWTALASKNDLVIMVTNPSLESQEYGFSFDVGDLTIIDFRRDIDFQSFDICILPSLDSKEDILRAFWLVRKCRQANVPVVLWSERWAGKATSYSRRLEDFIRGLFYSIIGRKATHCVVSGTKAKKYLLERGIDIGKISIAFDSSNAGELDENLLNELKETIPSGKNVILFFGRLMELKGIYLLIAAYRKLRQERNDIFLLICGDGPEYEAAQLEMSMVFSDDDYRFVGKVEPSQRVSYFTLAKVFVLPSMDLDGVIEPWGLTVNEALEVGLPVVTTTAVGSGFDLISPEVGRLVPEKDIEALAIAIDEIIDCNAEGGMSTACRMRAKQFSVEKMADEFEQALINCLERGK